MLTHERHECILELLKTKRNVTVTELTKEFDASESTIRRDLVALNEQGLLKKVHGGATAIDNSYQMNEPDVATKAIQNVDEKVLIGRYAASLIKDDDFVYIDAGTTTESMIDYINNSKAIFVTNGIAHAKKLLNKGCKTYVIGGEIKSSTEAIVGADGLNNLAKYNFTKCFVGANGFTHDKGFTTPDTEEALMKTEAIERSFISYVLADHSKAGIVCAVSFADIDQACIITDYVDDERIKESTIVKELK